MRKKKDKIVDFASAQEQEQRERQFRKEKAEAAPIWRFMGVIGIAAVAVYFVANVASYLLNPLTTTVAYTYQSDDAVSVTGLLCRAESVFPEQGGLLFVSREEGERVSEGGRVATVYASQAALDTAQELRDLKLQLEQLEFAQSTASGSQEILKLDTTIKDSIRSLKAAVAQEDYSTLRRESDALETYVLKRDFTHDGQVDVSTEIQSVQQQIASLSSASRSVSSYVTAKQSGFYSVLVDGYETVLTPEALMEMTPSQFQSLKPDAAVSSNVGKLITDSIWYYATTMKEGEPPRVGQKVTLQFLSGFTEQIPMEVTRVSTAENGRCLVVLKADTYLTSTTLLRDQSAEIIVDTVTGIRVPKTALRLVEATFETEDGGEETRMVSGVYCLMGRTARFKPVEVVLEEEDYYLVEPTPEDMGYSTESKIELYTLREGETVIVTAKDLYDGKVMD